MAMFNWLSIHLWMAILFVANLESTGRKCGSRSSKWCESSQKCIHKSSSCFSDCTRDKFWCKDQGKCIPKTERCCNGGVCECFKSKHWCKEENMCIPDKKKCSSDCDKDKFWCAKQGRCLSKTDQCCSESMHGKQNCDCFQSMHWCRKKKKCIPENEYCCEPDENFCNIRGICIPVEEKCVCQENKYVCNKINRKICINKKEVCEPCQTEEIMCTYLSKGNIIIGCYSTTTFNHPHFTLQICQNGKCHEICETNINNCQKGTYKCGKECRPNQEFIHYKTCEEKCIRRNETCLREEVGSLNLPLLTGLGTGGAILCLLLGGSLVFLIFLRKKKNEVLYVDQNSVYGESGEEEYEMNEIIDTNDYYGADNDDDESE